jgi:hypothetical protein
MGDRRWNFDGLKRVVGVRDGLKRAVGVKVANSDF